jgi:hypothetical protein
MYSFVTNAGYTIVNEKRKEHRKVRRKQVIALCDTKVSPVGNPAGGQNNT